MSLCVTRLSFTSGKFTRAEPLLIPIISLVNSNTSLIKLPRRPSLWHLTGIGWISAWGAWYEAPLSFYIAILVRKGTGLRKGPILDIIIFLLMRLDARGCPWGCRYLRSLRVGESRHSSFWTPSTSLHFSCYLLLSLPSVNQFHLPDFSSSRVRSPKCLPITSFLYRKQSCPWELFNSSPPSPFSVSLPMALPTYHSMAMTWHYSQYGHSLCTLHDNN